MQNRRLDEGRAAVVRALQTKANACPADKRARRILFNIDARRGLVIGVKDMAVPHLKLRLNEEVVERRIVPAQLSGDGNGVRVILAGREHVAHADVKRVLHAADLAGDVKVKPVVPELAGISREGKQIAVAVAVIEVVVAVRVGKGAADKESLRNLAVVAELQRGVLVLNVLAAEGGLAVEDAGPDAVGLGGACRRFRCARCADRGPPFQQCRTRSDWQRSGCWSRCS